MTLTVTLEVNQLTFGGMEYITLEEFPADLIPIIKRLEHGGWSMVFLDLKIFTHPGLMVYTPAGATYLYFEDADPPTLIRGLYAKYFTADEEVAL